MTRRVPVFGRGLRIVQPTAAPTQSLKLVRCAECRSPVGRYASGSRAEVKCARCGVVVRVELR